MVNTAVELFVTQKFVEIMACQGELGPRCIICTGVYDIAMAPVIKGQSGSQSPIRNIAGHTVPAFHQKLGRPYLKFDSNSIPCRRYSTDSVTTKFCTCHDSTAVVACTKFRCDSVASISLITNSYLGFPNLKCPNFVVKCIRFCGTKETHVCQ